MSAVTGTYQISPSHGIIQDLFHQLARAALWACRCDLMGASSSSSAAAPDELTGQFDANELKVLQKAYTRLANPSTGVLEPKALEQLAPGVPWAALYAAMGFQKPDDMAKVLSGPPSTGIRFRNFLQVVASVCKGRPSERRLFVAGAIYTDPPGSSLVSQASLVRLLSDAAIAARGGNAGEPPAGMEAVAADALLGTNGSVPAVQWASWLNAQIPALPVALETFLLQYLCALGRLADGQSLPSGGVLELPNGVLKAVQEPLLRPADGQEEGHELLQPTTAWLLHLALGSGSAGESPSWRCLYASRVMGLSMNRFNHHGAGYAGPTLLVALTEDGEIFGAYLDTPLKASDKFVGGGGSFLFTLQPHFHIYRPTNISKNFILFNPPQTGALSSESYFRKGSDAVPEVIGFGGQTARLRLGLEDDLNTLRWHHSCTTYAAHPHADLSVKEGTRKVRALELWGCGGADADAVQKALRDRRARDANRAGQVDRAAMFGLGGGEDWRAEDSVDRMILETAGAHTFYSNQLERVEDQVPREIS